MVTTPSILLSTTRQGLRCCQRKRERTWSLPSASVMLIGVHFGSVSSMTIEADADKVHALREQFSNIDGTSIIS